jgi:phospholipase C
MRQGDNWIGSVMSALMNGPQWSSTAVFITYDDFGGFYDHVPPPAGSFGIRIPMVIVSPYAKRGYTDSSTASIASVQAFIESTFGISPLTAADATAYDYANSFDYGQTPNAATPMATRRISQAEQRWLAVNPVSEDEYAAS